MVKTCTKCKVEKDVVEFHKNKYKKDGLKSECKYCQKEYREANKELIKERKKKYYKANKEKIKAYKEATREHRNEWRKQKRSKDTLYKLKCNLRVQNSKSI